MTTTVGVRTGDEDNPRKSKEAAKKADAAEKAAALKALKENNEKAQKESPQNKALDTSAKSK